MTTGDVNRREFVSALGTLGGLAASAWAIGNPAELRAAAVHAEASAPQDKYQVLNAEQVRELDAVTSTIVPTDGTPGAREARVVRFIDRSLATYAKDQKAQIEGALKALGDFTAAQRSGNRSFAAVPVAERTTLLEAFERAHGGDFNGGFFFPTMIGMFANPSYGGNAGRVGWQLMGFTDQFSWSAPFGYYDRG